MRIKTFCKFVEVRELEPLTLRDTTVVVDGANFFYNTYTESGLPYMLGCESDRYASYLRDRLAMFKKANIKCYFLFQGGHRDMEKRLKKFKDFDSRQKNPLFKKTICKEVLDEMGFPYVHCEYESKKDIIALAQKLDCPVISYDIEYCFSGLQYIPLNELKFNERDNAIDCRYFRLDKFMRKYKLTAETLAVFIVLTDENIFPENFFVKFFEHIKAPERPFQRNLDLLYWLSKKCYSLETVYKFVSLEDKQKFDEEVAKAKLMIGRREAGGLGAACLLDRGAAAVARRDPDWFPKGVAGNHVAIDYVDLYRSKTFIGSPSVEQDDPMFLSLDFVKYAYDLLTDYQNDGFTFVYDSSRGRQTLTVMETHSIPRPQYEAAACVFENGWGSLRGLRLLEHFLQQSVQLVDWRALGRLPEDARLLVAALVYFSRKKLHDTSAEAACVLLCYVALGVVRDRCDRAELPRPPFAARPVRDSTTDPGAVSVADCNTAAAILEEFTSTEWRGSDRELQTPLVEFQHCLRQLMDLNALCGAPLAPPRLGRCYSGSLALGLRRAARCAGDTQQFLDGLLSPAPTVYALLNGLIEVYQQL